MFFEKNNFIDLFVFVYDIANFRMFNILIYFSEQRELKKNCLPRTEIKLNEFINSKYFQKKEMKCREWRWQRYTELASITMGWLAFDEMYTIQSK